MTSGYKSYKSPFVHPCFSLQKEQLKLRSCGFEMRRRYFCGLWWVLCRSLPAVCSGPCAYYCTTFILFWTAMSECQRTLFIRRQKFKFSWWSTTPNISVFLGVFSCIIVEIDLCFGSAYCLLHQGDKMLVATRLRGATFQNIFVVSIMIV